MELLVANHQYLLLEDDVILIMVVLLHLLLNTLLIDGNLLDIFSIHELFIEQSKMTIESMSSVEMQHSKSYTLNLSLVFISISLFSETEIWSLDQNDNTINMKIADPKLYFYYSHPELFIVDSDFCIKK